MSVIHKFNVDFSTLKEGDSYQSLCGRKYIACEPPTETESRDIAHATRNYPICKRCLKRQEQQLEDELSACSVVRHESIVSSPDMSEQLAYALEAIRNVLGHSNCYCIKCTDISKKYYIPRRGA